MMRFTALAMFIAAFGLGLYLVPAGPTARAVRSDSSEPKVKLAVVVFFDQMRGDFVEKWQPYFGDDGFCKIQTDGVWFTDCHYPYATTTTAPGHSSVLAGCSADKNGVINNNWYDRMSASEITAATSPRYEFVPAPKGAKDENVAGVAPLKRPAVGNPDRLLAESLGDVVKATTQGRVFGISLKDRAAIFPVGKKPDGAYWFTGQFVTSTYYRDSLPRWVAEFNASGFAQQWQKQTWDRLRPDLDYNAIVGPDDGPGEGSGPGRSKALGTTFPKTLGEGKEYYENLTATPWGNDLVWEFAKKCIVAERLGQGQAADLLSISYSANDILGHVWGPDSHEVFDMTLRSDRLVADMIRFLDAQIGPGNYSLTITADHGICPNPEVSAARGIDAKRINPKTITEGLEAALTAKFGQPKEPNSGPMATGGVSPRGKIVEEKTINVPAPAPTAKKDWRWIEAVSFPHVYFNLRALTDANLTVDQAADVAAAWLKTQDGVLNAYTMIELQSKTPTDDPILVQCRKSYHPSAAGELMIVNKPYYLLDSYGTGTTHGAPHDYDTHTVFLVYGPGLSKAKGKQTQRITPQHAAVINAKFLGIRPPNKNEYDLPDCLK